MDNASNNDTMLKSIEVRCIKAGIPFSANDARGRCMPHTIHLSAIIVSVYYCFIGRTNVDNIIMLVA